MSQGAFFTLDDGPAPDFDCYSEFGKVKAKRFDLDVPSLRGREHCVLASAFQQGVLLWLVSLEMACHASAQG